MELVLSGRMEKAFALPAGSRWLGHLADEQVPALLNAVDAVAVVNRRSAFGNYSYPAKLYEAMCCRVPAVATSTPASSWILKDHPELLVAPADPADLKEKLKASLLLGRMDYGPQLDWETITLNLEKALEQLGRSRKGGKWPQARSPIAGDA